MIHKGGEGWREREGLNFPSKKMENKWERERETWEDMLENGDKFIKRKEKSFHFLNVNHVLYWDIRMGVQNNFFTVVRAFTRAFHVRFSLPFALIKIYKATLFLIKICFKNGVTKLALVFIFIFLIFSLPIKPQQQQTTNNNHILLFVEAEYI
mgnify:CR=1 FL=1